MEKIFQTFHKNSLGHHFLELSKTKHFWINMPFLDECAIFGGTCHFWRNVPFLDECAIFGGMCHFWRNVSFL